jgi:hypothetical protein
MSLALYYYCNCICGCDRSDTNFPAEAVIPIPNDIVIQDFTDNDNHSTMNEAEITVNEEALPSSDTEQADTTPSLAPSREDTASPVPAYSSSFVSASPESLQAFYTRYCGKCYSD